MARAYVWIARVKAGFVPEPNSNTLAPRRSLLLVSLFDGIGGILQAMKLLGAPVDASIVCECSRECRKVTRKAFNVSLEYVWIESIDHAVVAEWASRFGECDVFWSAGSPCQNFSKLTGASRLGLQGNKSYLFWHVPRIVALLKLHFRRVRGLFENVKSMPDADFHTISAAMPDCQIVGCDAKCVTWCRRPRVYFLDNFTLDKHEDVKVIRERRCDEFEFACTIPKAETFLEHGSTSHLEGDARLPTFTRPIPKQCKPDYVPGWDHTSEEAKERYYANRLRYQPYQYENSFLINGSRLPSAVERERLMGFQSNHTLSLAKSFLTKDIADHEDSRCEIGRASCRERV